MRNRPIATAVLAPVALASAVLVSACSQQSTSSSASTSAAAATSMAKDAMPKDTMTKEAMPKDTMTKDATMAAPTASGAAMAKGAYVTMSDYKSSMAKYQGTKTVLFFHASWCPNCKATDQALTSAPVPDGLTVVKVDYDGSDDLKQKYGVTQQHTFVQIDAQGNAVKKWTGTKDGAAIKGNTV